MKNMTSLTNYSLPIHGSLRIFWKIVIDGDGGSLRAVKEVALWGIHYAINEQGNLIDDQGRTHDSNGTVIDEKSAARRWHRYLWKQIPLQVEIGAVNEEADYRAQDKISVEDGHIFFKGGYLRIFDPGLRRDVTDWGFELAHDRVQSDAAKYIREAFLEPVSAGDVPHRPDDPPSGWKPQFEKRNGAIAYLGYNVRLETDIAVEADHRHPLFYYPQDPTGKTVEAVSLNVVTQSARHELQWSIAQRSASREYFSTGPHQIVINQQPSLGQNAAAVVNDTFSFLVDAVPLGGGQSDDSYRFSTEGNIFYVGYSSGAVTSLRGYVRRIVFDPNASCLGCAV